MKARFNYDAVLKDLFQQDRPSLLAQLAGPAKIREFLNVELAVVEERVADLLALLSDGTILHIDFQSNNHRDMAYRMGVYGLLVARKYRRPIRQVVLYMGREKLRMPRRIDLGEIQVAYHLMDIRELDVEAFLASGRPGDYALALLARGGTERLRQIIKRANQLAGPERQRVLTQLAVLSGLRGASEKLTMELKSMGISVEIDQNVFLKNIHDAAKAEGKAEGMLAILREQLQAKFGPLPKWADQRLAKATGAQTERWARRVLTASSLESVIGRK